MYFHPLVLPKANPFILMKKPQFFATVPNPGLCTPKSNPFLISEKKSCKILFALSFFLLLALQSVKAQYSVTEMSRFISGNNSDNSVAIKNIGGFTYIIGTTSSTDLPVTNSSSYKGSNDIYIAKLNSAGTIIFSSYFGGSESETLSFKNSFEVVGNDVFILCNTQSADLPVTNGTVYQANGDAAVVKMNTVTGTIGFCTYYGGNGYDNTQILKVDNGSVYLGAISPSTDLPVTNGSVNKGGNDLTFAKLNGNTGNIIWATYWGGNANEDLLGMEVSGNTVHFTGFGNSTNTSLPSTDGSLNQGNYDAYYTKLNATTGSASFLTFYGANAGYEIPTQLKLVAGEAYILGYTTSFNFPSTNGTIYRGGAADVFVLKYNSAGVLVYATVIGGNDYDYSPAFDVVSGNVYFVTNTGSANFPVTNGSVYSGSYDIALTKINASGNILFSTLIGGSGYDAPSDVKVDCNDNAFILGSISTGYPVTNGSSLSGGAGNINAISVINCNSGQLVFSTYVNRDGSGSPAMAVLGNGIVEYFGTTDYAAYPVTLSGNSASPSSSGPGDFILTRINTCPTGFTGNTAVNPATQNICSNGIAGIINMAPATLPGTAQPLLYINGVSSVPADIPATRYQWQIAAAVAGPWLDIPGAVSQNYSPDNQTADRYYRRLAQSVCCGVATTEQTGDVAAILISNTAPTVDAGGPFTTCAGTPVIIGGSPTATPAPGNSITSYLWTPAGGYTPGDNVANPSVSPAVSTIYSVLVTDNLGCQQIGQAQVNVYAANAGPDKSTCSNATVRIGTAPVVGVPGVTYSWTASPADPGMSCTNCAQPDVNPAVTTTYTLTMTIPVSGGGTCFTTDDVIVNVVAAPLNNGGAFGGPDVTICYGGTGLLGTPAEAGFTYTWAPGNYLSSISIARPTFQPGSLNFPNPNPFKYYITAQKNGCIFVDSVKAFVIKADAGTDMCGPTLIGTPDGTPNINETYSWTKLTAGAGTSNFLGGTNTAQVPVSSCTVTTTFRVTVTFNGTTCTDDVIVDPCTCAIPTITVVAPFDCASYSVNGGNVALIATSPLPSTFTWSPAAGLSSTTGDTVYLTDNVPRTYTVVATSIYDPTYSCSNTIDVNNPVSIKPSFTAQDVSVCPGTGINIGQPSVAGYSYLWSQAFGLNSTTVSNPVATVNSTTDYQVVVTDVGTGCTVKDTATVTVYNLPSNVAGNNISLCGSGIAQLGVSSVPGVTYLWTPAAAYNPGNTSANPTVPVAATTTFFVTATNTAGGCTVNGSVTITVNPAMAPFSFTDQTFCPGVAGALALPAGPTGAGYTYSWSPAALVTNPTSNGPTATTLNPRPANTTTYILTVTDAAGCSNNASVTFTPTVSVPDAGNDKIICLSSGPVMLGYASAPTGGGITYSWSPATGLSSTTIPNPVFTPAAAGTTTYTLTKTEGGCSTTDDVVVTVQDFTMPAIPAQTVCQNACTQIGVTPQTGVSYLWTPAAGLSNTAIANPMACPSVTTTYRLTGTGINGCQARQDVLVRVVTDPSPTVTIPDVTTCLGSPAGAAFNPTIGPAGTYSYLWGPDDATLSNVYIQNPGIYAVALGTKTYNLNLINQSTGCATNAPANLTVVDCRTLPVKLENFSATLQGKAVLLDWKVSEEDNLSRYEIQYSVNGVTFSKIGEVTASGSRNYNFLHGSPVQGNNYYRLKIIDNNGQYTYSATRKVTISRPRGNLSIYPNPARDEVSITMPSSFINKTVRINVYNFDGKLMLRKDVRSLGQTEVINISKLPAGIYAIVVAGANEIYNSKFIISR